MERFNLKSWCVGFEVPFIDEIDSTKIVELSSKLKELYKDWFESILMELNTIQISNQNYLLLFNVVIMVDSLDETDVEESKNDWNEFKDLATQHIDEFLKSTKLPYKLIHE